MSNAEPLATDGEASTIYDTVDPEVTLTLSESDPYAHVDGDTVYYGPFTGSFTVTAALTDATSGLAEVVFPETTAPGATYDDLGGAQDDTRSWPYDFTAASSFSATATVTATDRATNATLAPFEVVRDAVSPTLSLDAAAQGSDIVVTWEARDDESGVGSCTLEMREEGEETWTWLTNDCDGPYTYLNPTSGLFYTFRLTASDNVSNTRIVEAQAALSRVTKYYYHGGQRVAMRQGSVVYYLHGDHLGSTSLATDAGSDVVARQLYHPYGTVRYTEGTLPTDFGFTGQRHDGTDLIFMHARFYDPYINRFISADTMVPEPGNPQDLNRYAYVRNNPLRYTDPSGYYSEEEIMQSFGVSTWDEVLAYFQEGVLEGRWGWLEILRRAEDGYMVKGEYTGYGVWAPEVECDGQCWSAGDGGYLSRSEEGKILVGNEAHSKFAIRYNEYTLQRPGRPRYLSPYPEFYTRAEWVHYHLKFDPSRVNWTDVTLDSVSTVGSVVGANPVAQTFKYSARIQKAGRTADTVFSVAGLVKGLAVDQDPNAVILGTGGFIPGPAGGGFNLASVYFDLEAGFYWTP